MRQFKVLAFQVLLSLALICPPYPYTAGAQRIGDGALDIPTKKTLKNQKATGAGQQSEKGKKPPAPRPPRKRNLDGVYEISAVQVAKRNSWACLSTYNMTLTIKNGQAGHKIPFSHYVAGTVRGNRLRMSSGNEGGDGHWIGEFELSHVRGRKTSGYFKWTGGDKECAFSASVVRK